MIEIHQAVSSDISIHNVVSVRVQERFLEHSNPPNMYSTVLTVSNEDGTECQVTLFSSKNLDLK